MERYAFLTGDTVDKVLLYEPDRAPEGGILVTDETGEAAPGFKWDGQTFTAPPLPEPTTEEIAVGIRAEGAHRLLALVAEYTPAERETWKGQIAEAAAVLAGGSSAMIEALAEPRGITPEAMAQIIVAKDAALKAASGAVLAAQAALLAMDPLPADYRDGKWWP